MRPSLAFVSGVLAFLPATLLLHSSTPLRAESSSPRARAAVPQRTTTGDAPGAHLRLQRTAKDGKALKQDDAESLEDLLTREPSQPTKDPPKDSPFRPLTLPLSHSEQNQAAKRKDSGLNSSLKFYDDPLIFDHEPLDLPTLLNDERMRAAAKAFLTLFASPTVAVTSRRHRDAPHNLSLWGLYDHSQRTKPRSRAPRQTVSPSSAVPLSL